MQALSREISEDALLGPHDVGHYLVGPGQQPDPGGNCIKIGLPGKLILGDYFYENRTY